MTAHADRTSSDPLGVEQVEVVATENKRGLTLDQLARFVQRAMTAEVPGDAVVAARVSFRQRLQRVEVKTRP